MSWIGTPVRRLEDAALLTGKGRFVDDLPLPGVLECAFVRSMEAHARIENVDTEAAKSCSGVHAVYVLDDLRQDLTSVRMPLGHLPEQGEREITPYVLAGREVCYVGEPIAVVVAETRYLAEDAAAMIAVETTPLPVVSDARAALDDTAPPVHSETNSNLVRAFSHSYGDVGAAFADAPFTEALSLLQRRGVASPLEGRGVAARADPADARLTVWSSTQMPHDLHAGLVRMLGLEESCLRVITPDVGGGFGCKHTFYPEEVVIALAALRLDRPVKWIEDRHEHFLSAMQERDQYWDLEAAFEADGLVRGLRGTLIHDQGAYTTLGFNLAYNAATSATGVYVIPAFDMRILVAETNKVPTAPVRGAGYPQGNFAIERVMDRIADRLGLPRDEVRRRNLVPADRMPYETPLRTRAGTPVRFDSGDFPACQAKALDAIAFGAAAQRKSAARSEGRLIGVGIANGIKGTGRGPFESGVVRVGRSGRITAITGALAMGQGLRTAFSQIVADALGVEPSDITVIAGDTSAIALGQGGFASRQTVTAGSALKLAASKVRAKAIELAAHLLDVPAADLTLSNGRVHPSGNSNRAVTLAELAEVLAGSPGFALPGNIEPGLEANAHFMPEGLTYAYGSHAVELEVDPETGKVTLLNYVAVSDVGKRVNPMIVEGQIHGGIANGIGNALMEQMVYDDAAQPLSTDFGSYLMPGTRDVPPIELHFLESPSPLNPLGVKGAGEVGVLPVVAAIVSAIEDALSEFGIQIDHYPVLPMDIVGLLGRARDRTLGPGKPVGGRKEV